MLMMVGIFTAETIIPLQISISLCPRHTSGIWLALSHPGHWGLSAATIYSLQRKGIFNSRIYNQKCITYNSFIEIKGKPGKL